MCLFSDWTQFLRKKLCLFSVDRNPTLVSASYLATLLWRKDDEYYFSPKLRVRFKDNTSPHGKFHQFLFPFSSKFSDLNFTSYVLYIYLMYYVTCHTQWAWVTYGLTTVPRCLYQEIKYLCLKTLLRKLHDYRDVHMSSGSVSKMIFCVPIN